MLNAVIRALQGDNIMYLSEQVKIMRENNCNFIGIEYYPDKSIFAYRFFNRDFEEKLGYIVDMDSWQNFKKSPRVWGDEMLDNLDLFEYSLKPYIRD